MTAERESYSTMAEWREANEAWKAAGRPGGNAQRPVLASSAIFGDCPTCGGTTIKDMALAPAFPTRAFLEKLCRCTPPSSENQT